MQENVPNFKIVPRSFSCTEDANGNVTIVDYSEKVDLSPIPMELVADDKRRGRNAKMDTFLSKVNGSTLASFPSPTAMNVGPAMADIEPPPYDLARLGERFAASNGEDKQKDDDKCPSCNVRYGWHDITCQAITASNW